MLVRFFLLLFFPAYYSVAFGTEIRLLNAVSFNANFYLKNGMLGGISGLHYDPQSKTLYAVTDDKSEFGPPRFFIFDLLQTKDGQWDLKERDSIETKNKKGKRYQLYETDDEAITIDPSTHHVLIASEGTIDLGPTIFPSLLEYSTQGEWLHEVDLPDFVKGDFKRHYGVFDNRAVESISFSPDNQYFFFATEYLLTQDKKLKDSEGEYCHFFRSHFDVQKGLTDVEQFLYELSSPISKLKKIKGRGNTGLSEIESLNNNQILALERGNFNGKTKIGFRLFKGTLPKDADKKGESGHPLSVQKEIILDSDDLVDSLPGVTKNFLKMEGMTFGPELANGERLLILASDNDFKFATPTLFLFFSYKD